MKCVPKKCRGSFGALCCRVLLMLVVAVHTTFVHPMLRALPSASASLGCRIASLAASPLHADASKVIIAPTCKVRVWHAVPEGLLQQVKEQGLLTYATLVKRGLAVKLPFAPFPDDLNAVRFSFYDDTPKARAGQRWVSIAVDAEQNYVYNSAFRKHHNYTAYQQSKVLLATYLNNLEKASELRTAGGRALVAISQFFGTMEHGFSSNARPSTVYLHPFTAEPFCSFDSDERQHFDPSSRLARELDRMWVAPDYCTPATAIYYSFTNELLIPHDVPAKDMQFPDAQKISKE